MRIIREKSLITPNDIKPIYDSWIDVRAYKINEIEAFCNLISMIRISYNLPYKY